MKGITRMTKEKHRFSGFVVRAQIQGNGFRMYVSANSIGVQRAKEQSSKAYSGLQGIIQDPGSWKKGWEIKSHALKRIKDIGFRHFKVALKPKNSDD